MYWNIWQNRILTVSLLCVGLMVYCPGVGAESEIPKQTFHWVSANTGFRNENGAQLEVPYLSNLVITCPYRVDEYYKIYWVSKEVYENCFIPTNLSKPLDTFLICDSPYQGSAPKFFELFIQEFNGVFGQRDFQNGHNYYLATLSSGTYRGLNNTYQGACRDHNNGLYMKLNISVVDKPKPTTKAPDGTHPHTTKKPLTVRTTHHPTPTTSRRRPTTPSPITSTKKATTKLKTTSRPLSTDIPDINSGDIIIDGANGGNSAIIDANDAGRSVTFSWLIVLISICLSVFHLLQVVR